MLKRRRGAAREARKVFAILNCFTAGKNEKRPKRVIRNSARRVSVAIQQSLTIPKNVDAPSECSELPEGRSLPSERETRELAKSNNQRFYHYNLQTDNDIRLLRIPPGEGHFDATLERASLLSPPEFDSLSYCWGEQSDLRSVTIDGQDGFQVSKHLHAALLRLRRKDRERLVWVDVICVNQANVSERNRSVNLMWRIYTAAQRVIIWIGELDGDKQTCKRLYPGNEKQSAALTLCAKPGLAALEHGNLASYLGDVLREMELDSSRKQSTGEVWWKRLWVVQEFSCSQELPTVYLGPHAISWNFFSDLMVTETHDRLQLFHELRTQDDQNLFNLLLMAKLFHCSDPRDRIYALLGLAKETDVKVVPDYSRSIAQVYEDATLHIVDEEQNMDVLLDDRLSRTDDKFPTWVPNFEMLRERRLVKTVDDYSAGDGIPHVSLVQRENAIPWSLTPNILRMKALYFDEIISRTSDGSLIAPDIAHRPIMHSHFHGPALSEPLQTIAFVLQKLQLDYTAPPPHGLDRSPAIGYLMLEYLLGSTGIGSVSAAFSRISKLKPNLERLRPRIQAILSSHGLPTSASTIDDFLVSVICESVFLWCRHKRSCAPIESTRELLGGQRLYTFHGNTHKRDFFGTKHGFVGLGSASLQIGDIIVVPFGASRPFILRKSASQGSTTYSLVGDAVVHGIMSGQLMNLYKEGSLKAESYDLG